LYYTPLVQSHGTDLRHTQKLLSPLLPREGSGRDKFQFKIIFFTCNHS